MAVVEREEDHRAWLAPEFRSLRVRYLERLPLGTPYARVVLRMGELLRDPQMAGVSRLTVDATGVGAPVVEMLRGARLGVTVTAVTITGGAAAHGVGENWSVPKRDLMAGLVVLLEQGQLKIPRGLRESASLMRELSNWGTVEHDDLVVALALACWRTKRAVPVFGTQRLPGI